MNLPRWILPIAMGTALLVGGCGGDDDDWDRECRPRLIGDRVSTAEAYVLIRDKRFRPDDVESCHESDSIEFDSVGNAQAYDRNGRRDGDPLPALNVLEALGSGYRERDGDIYKLEVYRARINGVDTVQLVELENGRVQAVYLHP